MAIYGNQTHYRSAASTLLSDAEISDAVAYHAPRSWEAEETAPDDLRSADELAADDAGVLLYGPL